MSIDDMMSLRGVGGASISPNGALVVYQVSAWEHPAAVPAKGDTARGDKHEMRSHLWLVSTDGSQPARQLTFSERGESQPAWSPDGSTIAFLSSRGTATGDDQPRSQIYLLRFDGGEAQKLSDVKEGVTGFSWSPDGKRIAFLSTDSLPKETEAARKRRDDAQVFEGDLRLSHVFTIDVATKQTKELVHTAQYTVRGAPDWSPDGTRLAYLTSPTTLIRDERRAAFIVDANSGALQKIDPGPDMHVQNSPQWSPDGRTLAFTTLKQTHRALADSMMEREIANDHLILWDVAAKHGKDVASADFDNSPGALTWSPDGQSLYFTAGTGVWSSAFRFDVASGKYNQLTRNQIVRGVTFSKDGKRVAMILDSPMTPGEVHVTDNAFSAPRRLTNTNPQLADIALGESEVISWKSSDGQTVEGVLL